VVVTACLTIGAVAAWGCSSSSSAGPPVCVIPLSPDASTPDACQIFRSSTVAQITAACNEEQSVVASSCPSGYLGCCTIGHTSEDGGSFDDETCYYTAVNGTPPEEFCTVMGGVWSTNP
jgi:hypothetical protein